MPKFFLEMIPAGESEWTQLSSDTDFTAILSNASEWARFHPEERYRIVKVTEEVLYEHYGKGILDA